MGDTHDFRKLCELVNEARKQTKLLEDIKKALWKQKE